MKAHVHAVNSAKKFGGQPEDYLAIHQLLDSSRAAFPDVRHRVATHTSWFITTIIPLVFGETITNSDSKVVSTKAIAEEHVLEDFGYKFIPSLQDFAQEIELKDWMDNGLGSLPSSRKKASGIPDRPPTIQETTQDDDEEHYEPFDSPCWGAGVID